MSERSTELSISQFHLELILCSFTALEVGRSQKRNVITLIDTRDDYIWFRKINSNSLGGLAGDEQMTKGNQFGN